MDQPNPRRPLAVWIAQAFLAVLGLLCPIPFVHWLQVLAFGESWLDRGPGSPNSLILLPIGTGFLVGAVAISKRKNWGRWLSIGALASVMLLVIWITFFYPDDDSAFTDWETFSMELVSVSAVLSPFLFLIGLLSFGKSVNAYFRPTPTGSDDASRMEPPPPPEFDV